MFFFRAQVLHLIDYLIEHVLDRDILNLLGVNRSGRFRSVMLLDSNDSSLVFIGPSW